MELYTNRKKVHSVIASLYGADEKINQIKAMETEFLIKAGDQMGARDFANTASEASKAITTAIGYLAQILGDETAEE